MQGREEGLFVREVLFEELEDGDGLPDYDFTPVFVCESEGGYACGGIGSHVGRVALFVFEEVDVAVFEGYPFEVRRCADARGAGGAEVGV